MISTSVSNDFIVRSWQKLASELEHQQNPFLHAPMPMLQQQATVLLQSVELLQSLKCPHYAQAKLQVNLEEMINAAGTPASQLLLIICQPLTQLSPAKWKETEHKEFLNYLSNSLKHLTSEVCLQSLLCLQAKWVKQFATEAGLKKAASSIQNSLQESVSQQVNRKKQQAFIDMLLVALSDILLQLESWHSNKSWVAIERLAEIFSRLVEKTKETDYERFLPLFSISQETLLRALATKHSRIEKLIVQIDRFTTVIPDFITTLDVPEQDNPASNHDLARAIEQAI